MFDDLYRISRRSLSENIVTTEKGSYLSAGAHQFRSLWTRDFCLASQGLLAISHSKVVEDHIQRLLDSMREEDGLVPRILDSMRSDVRVVINTVLGRIPGNKSWPIKEPLNPEYLGEHKTMAMDSNALLAIMIGKLHKKTNNQDFIDKNNAVIGNLLKFYQPHFVDGLIRQQAFSDWQDSAKRIGETSYINLLYIIAAETCDELSVDFAENLLDVEAFYKKFLSPDRSQLYSDIDKGRMSLDAPLLLLDFQPKSLDLSYEQIYRKLKSSILWKQFRLPGVCSDQNYPAEEVSWTCKLAGLKNYHGVMWWSWLSGLAAKVAYKMGDIEEAYRILKQLEFMARRDDAIFEIYDQNLKPYRNFVYRSEGPFSWGAGKTLEALELARS